MLTVDYEKFELRAGDLLLDLGCGFGRHTYEALVRGAHFPTLSRNENREKCFPICYRSESPFPD